MNLVPLTAQYIFNTLFLKRRLEIGGICIPLTVNACYVCVNHEKWENSVIIKCHPNLGARRNLIQFFRL